MPKIVRVLGLGVGLGIYPIPNLIPRFFRVLMSGLIISLWIVYFRVWRDDEYEGSQGNIKDEGKEEEQDEELVHFGDLAHAAVPNLDQLLLTVWMRYELKIDDINQIAIS